VDPGTRAATGQGDREGERMEGSREEAVALLCGVFHKINILCPREKRLED